jgi:hypothetical protein
LLQSLKVNKKIENPFVCKVRPVIWFLIAKNIRPAEIHRQVVEVYDGVAMEEGNVMKLCRLFKESRSNVHVEKRRGRPSLVTDNLKGKVNANIREKWQFPISELHDHYSDVFWV